MTNGGDEAIFDIQLNGIGFTDLLETGRNSSYKQISGKTIGNGDKVTITDDQRIQLGNIGNGYTGIHLFNDQPGPADSTFVSL